MFDDDELDDIREGRDGWLGYDGPAADAVANSRPRRFVASLSGATVFLVVFLYLAWSTAAVFAMGIPGPFGGFCVEAQEIEGDDLNLHPAEGVTTGTGPDAQPLIYMNATNANVTDLTMYRDFGPIEAIPAFRVTIETTAEGGGKAIQVGDFEMLFSYMDTNYAELSQAEVYESGGFTETDRLNRQFRDTKLSFEAASVFLDRARARSHWAWFQRLEIDQPRIAIEPIDDGLDGECFSAPRMNQSYGSLTGDTTEEWIERVQFNRLDHQSGRDADGYQDLTFRGSKVAPGGEYEVIATVGRQNTLDQFTDVWFDWDKDTVVDDAETHDLGSCGEDGCTLADVVQVPEGGEEGQTLMRTIQRGGAEPAGFYTDVDRGEVLDYAVDYATANADRYDAVTANDSGLHVSRVRFGTGRFPTIDNVSGRAADGGYQDLTATVGHVAPAEAVPLAINVTDGASATVAVWIDWNGNEFLENWERYDLGTCTTPCTPSDKIDVPTHAAGGPTAMRVIVSNDSIADARGDVGAGQAVDYTVGVNNAYADAEDFDFVFADNRDTWISGVRLNDLNDSEPRTTVVDFNWAWPDCRNQGVTDLDTYFYPNSAISSDDGDFHEDDGGGVSGYTPAGECFLRTDADAYKAIYSDPDASDADQDQALDRYPRRGDVIEYREYVHRDGNDYGDVYFGRQGSGDFYRVRLDDTNSPSIALQRGVGGTVTTIASAQPNVPDGEFHHVEIDWGMGYADGGHIEVTFTNGATGDTTTMRAYDATYSDGGIGFGKANAGTLSYAHLWDRVTVNGKTRADVFDTATTFGQEGYEDRSYERTDVVRGEETTMSVTAEGADGTEVFASVFFDWNRNQYLGPDIAEAFRFLDDFEYGEPSEVDRPPGALVDNFANLTDPEYMPMPIDDFGKQDDSYNRTITGYNWALQDGVSDCDTSSAQQGLLDRYVPDSEIASDQDDQWEIRSGNGGNEPNVGECVLFTEGENWDGTVNTIYSIPGGPNAKELSYYPKRGETITYREAHFRGTDLMYLFGVQGDGTTSPNEFYGIYVEAWSDTDGSYTVPVELRKYTGGIGGSYTTLDSNSFTMDDTEWIDRDDTAIWQWRVDWGRSTSSDIAATLYGPDGNQRTSLGPVSDTSYDAGGIGHWSDRGSHTSLGVTYSNAGYVIDSHAAGEGCSLDPSYQGDTAAFDSQSAVTSGTSECALRGNTSNTTIHSPKGAGLDNYPERGERIRYDYRPSASDSDAALLFGASSGEDAYAVHTNLSDANDLALERREGGGALVLDEASAGFNAGSWHELLVDWGGPEAGDTITVTAFDALGNELASVSADDSRFDDGGVGYAIHGSNASYWDNVDVEQPQLYDEFRYENLTTIETFGSSDQPFETTVTDFGWPDCWTVASMSDPPLADYYYLGGGSGSDFEVMNTTGGDAPLDSDSQCTLFFEGIDWSGNPSWIFSRPGTPDTQSKEINYYPEQGDTITYNEAHYRGTDMMFMFGVESESEFYGVYIEAWSDSGGSYTVPVELRKYTGGIGGSYDVLDSNSFTMDDSEWIERSDDAIWRWEIDWDTNQTADNEIVAELFGPVNNSRVTLAGTDVSPYTTGGIGHWSDRGTHSSFGVTYSNAGYHWDVTASGTGCVLSEPNYRGDTDSFTSQSDVTYDTEQCALRGDDPDRAMYSLPGDGLGDYPQQGDRIRYLFNSSGGAGEFSFGVQDENGDNRYRARVNPSNGDGELRLDKFVEGSGEFIAFSDSIPLNENQWYGVRIDWGTEITLSIHDPSTGDEIGNVSATDREYTDGGIGFNRDTSGGSTVYWDDVRVENRYGVCSLSAYDEAGSDTSKFIAREYIDSDNTCQLSSDAADATLLSTSGLQTYPERGDNIRMDYWIENPDTISKFLFGVENENNYYALNVTDLPDGFALEKIESGAKTTLDSTNLTGDIPEGGGTLYDTGGPAEYPRHDINIQWGGIQPGEENVSNETISAHIFQYKQQNWTGNWFSASVEANDTRFDEGGIGFVKRRNETDRLYWDDVRIDNCKTYNYAGDRERIEARGGLTSTGRCALEGLPSTVEGAIYSTGRFDPRGTGSFAERGEVLRYDYRFERPEDADGVMGEFYFGPNPVRAGDTYGVRIDPEADKDQFMLFRCDCGEIVKNVSTQVNLRPDTWYTVEIAWGREGPDDDEIVARIFGPQSQLADISLFDSKYDEGQVGFRKRHGKGTSVWWDDVRVFVGQSEFDLGSCVISNDHCTIKGDIATPSDAQGGSVLMRTVLSENGYTSGPYNQTGAGEVVDHTVNVDTSLEPAPNASFAVTINGTNSPVEEGNVLEVTADIESTKSTNDTQNVTLEVGGVVRDSKIITLQPGNVTTETFSWNTSVGDEGSYQARVETVEDSDAVDVNITGTDAYEGSEGDASFEWVERVGLHQLNYTSGQGSPDGYQNLTNVSTPVDQGATYALNETAAGRQNDTQYVSAWFDWDLDYHLETRVDVGVCTTTEPRSDYYTCEVNTSVDVPVDADVNGTRMRVIQEFDEWPDGPYQDDFPGQTVDHTANVTFVNFTPATYQVTIDSTNSPIVEGETLDVNATIENIGEEPGSQEVVLDVPNGTQRDSQVVDLAGGESTSITLSWATADGDAGNYTAVVASDNDSDTANVTVEQSATFNVTTTGDNSPVVEGDTLTVTSDVTNTGDNAGTQDVDLELNGTVVDTITVSLSAGETKSVQHTVATEDGDAGDYNATVASEDDSDRRNVTILEQAYFDTTIVATNSPVEAGQTMTFDVNVTNTGEVQGTGDLNLSIDVGQNGTYTEEDELLGLTLGGGNSTVITLEWSTTIDDVGDADALVEAWDNSSSDAWGTDTKTNVTVESAPFFDVTITWTNEPVVEGETLNVTANVTNTGDSSDTQDIPLEINGSQEDVVTGVSLAAGESTLVNLSYTTVSGDHPALETTVLSNDSSDSRVVEILRSIRIDDFASGLTNQHMVDYYTGWASPCEDANALDQTPLSTYYYIGGGTNTDGELRTGNGNNEPQLADSNECVLFWEGADWSGNPAWIWSETELVNNADRINYYPGRGDTIHHRQAYFRSTTQMFMFGRQNASAFYAVRTETNDPSSSSPTIYVQLRKYHSGGASSDGLGSYDVLDSTSYTENDNHWIERDDTSIWHWYIYWHTATDGDIEVEKINPAGNTKAYLSATEGEYGPGPVGHYSTDGSHSSWGTTYSNAGYDIDFEVDSACGINRSHWFGDTSVYRSQGDVVATGSCALQGYANNTQMFSFDGNGLGTYPERGDRIKYWTRSSQATDGSEFMFGAQDANNYYVVRVFPDGNELRLDKWVGGSGNFLTWNTSGTINAGQWYEVQIDWGANRSDYIEIDVVDTNGDTVSSVTVNDTEFSDGGIGVQYDRFDGPDQVFWDDVRVETSR